MERFTPDLDLFQPVLTAADDAVGFDRPWPPWGIVFAAFFFGLTAGGALLSLNFRRLGQPERMRWGLALTLGVLLAWAFGVAGLLDAGRLDLTEDSRSIKTARKVLALCLAVGLAGFQAQRFRLFQFSDQPGGRYCELAFWGLLLGASLFEGGLVYAVFTAHGIRL